MQDLWTAEMRSSRQTTGIGMDEDVMEHIFDEHRKEQKRNGVGVPNVQKRLKLQYGSEYGIRYESVKGAGTKAVMHDSGRWRQDR